MAERLTREARSRLMAKVKGENTAPERTVRSLVHRMGYRFRLHRSDLPGKPDLVLPRHRKVIFVHGCFWHQHPGCRRADLPVTNAEFWAAKLEKNVARDRRVIRKLRQQGWKVKVIWECETRSPDALRARIRRFLESSV